MPPFFIGEKSVVKGRFKTLHAKQKNDEKIVKNT